MKRKIRVIQYGLGPIGQMLTKYLAERPIFEIVGAIDIDPSKVGADVGVLAGLDRPLGIKVSDKAEGVFEGTDADIVALTTASSIQKTKSVVLQIISHRLNIITTCEELSYPWMTNPEISQQIDKAAREMGVSVMSTGINPGFLMDYLPLAMTAVCREVKKITVERIQDAQFRRIPFLKKIGVGLDMEQFRQRVEDGSLKHVGLTESIHMISSKIGWKLDKTEDIISPVIAQQRVVIPSMTIEKGNMLGVQQIGRGYVDGQELITLIFRAAVGEGETRDRIIIEGKPDIDMVIKGGINGDVATCAIVTNAIPVVVDSEAGLKTMADSELISYII
jgi:hypothetical protein